MARSYLAPSPIKTIASANPNAPAVDLWTTLRVAHRVHSLNNNRPERNGNCVTHVVGQICYLCLRLLTRSAMRSIVRTGRGGVTAVASRAVDVSGLLL